MKHNNVHDNESKQKQNMSKPDLIQYVTFHQGLGVLVQFCTASMSAIMKLTKHGAIAPTHTPCLVIASIADMELVRNCTSAGLMCSQRKI